MPCGLQIYFSGKNILDNYYYYCFTVEEKIANFDKNFSKPGCSQIDSYAQLLKCDALVEFCV